MKIFPSRWVRMLRARDGMRQARRNGMSPTVNRGGLKM